MRGGGFEFEEDDVDDWHLIFSGDVCGGPVGEFCFRERVVMLLEIVRFERAGFWFQSRRRTWRCVVVIYLPVVLGRFGVE